MFVLFSKISVNTKTKVSKNTFFYFSLALVYEKLYCHHALEQRSKAKKESALVSGTCFFLNQLTLDDLAAR